MFIPEVFRFLSGEGCVALLCRVCWPDGVICPICGLREWFGGVDIVITGGICVRLAVRHSMIRLEHNPLL